MVSQLIPWSRMSEAESDKPLVVLIVGESPLSTATRRSILTAGGTTTVARALVAYLLGGDESRAVVSGPQSRFGADISLYV